VSIKIPKHVKSAWIKCGESKSIDKPWGHEYVWAGFSGIHGKTLFIKEGHRTSFKYHKLKTEILFFQKGTAEVTFGDEYSLVDPVGHPIKTCEISAGSSLMVQSGCPYRIRAISNCEIIEIGDNASDGPIRIEDDYGRIKNNEKNS
jgi:mannose-6-phosphate isomerase-like protein (cupin superfamily)